MTAEERILCAVPLFDAYELGCCLVEAARSGAALVMHDDRQPFVFGRERMLELLEREAVTVFPGVPFMFRLLAETPGRADLSRLRLCLSAANPLPWSTFQAFNRRFGIPVRQLYGTTETGALTANLDRDAEGTAMSVGRPIRRVEVKIVDETGAPQQEGRIGEIAVSSPAMTRGYAGLPDVNRHAFADGYFRTGDRGRIDNDGRLFLTGRKKLLIDVKGDKVDPIEVEDVLAVHPKVREVVVVGVSSGVDGEDLVKAVVVPERACEDRELIRFCRERLANFKVPRTVEFRDEIPRSAFGRVLRGLLADPDGSDASQVNHSTALSVDRA